MIKMIEGIQRYDENDNEGKKILHSMNIYTSRN